MTKDITVSSWGELHERLYEGSWQEPLGRFRSTVAFRGVGDAASDLSTSVSRLGRGHENIESHNPRAFGKYARRDRGPGDSIWTGLALAQPRGLPTRLLDWTFAPYVALHFCTEHADCFDRDGVIWCVDYVK